MDTVGKGVENGIKVLKRLPGFLKRWTSRTVLSKRKGMVRWFGCGVMCASSGNMSLSASPDKASIAQLCNITAKNRASSPAPRTGTVFFANTLSHLSVYPFRNFGVTNATASQPYAEKEIFLPPVFFVFGPRSFEASFLFFIFFK